LGKSNRPPQGRKKADVVQVELEVLVEEESAAKLLNGQLRSWLRCGSRVTIKVRKFRGKPDLLKNLPTLLNGYSSLRRSGRDIRVLVLVDQDLDDCMKLKADLESTAKSAGLITRRSAGGDSIAVVNRIAVRELENWYFGDWSAVQSAFPKVKSKVPALYSGNADRRDRKTSSEFEKALKRCGIQNSSKPDWAARVGPSMVPERNTSQSFQAFVEGARALVKEC
jgi:hypothetical protein